MKQLRIQFIRSSRPSVAGALALGLSALCAFFGTTALYLSTTKLSALHARVEALGAQLADQARPQQPEPPDARGAEQNKRIVIARDALMRPWADWFAALESLDSKGVALVSLEADAESRLRLSIRGKSIASAVRFIEAMSAGGFTDVTLLSQQADTSDYPLKFSISAGWPSAMGAVPSDSASSALPNITALSSAPDVRAQGPGIR
jgi:hypothetical protein